LCGLQTRLCAPPLLEIATAPQHRVQIWSLHWDAFDQSIQIGKLADLALVEGAYCSYFETGSVP